MSYPIDWAWWRFSEEDGEVLAARHHVAGVPLLVGGGDQDARVECRGQDCGTGRLETNLGSYVGENRGAWRGGR